MESEGGARGVEQFPLLAAPVAGTREEAHLAGLIDVTGFVAEVEYLVGLQAVEPLVLQGLLEEGRLGQRAAERPAALTVAANDGGELLDLVVPQHTVDELLGVVGDDAEGQTT